MATLVKAEKNITDSVLEKVNAFRDSGMLKIPESYSPENALKAAMLILGDMTVGESKKPVLDHCTKASVANALLKMVIWGLSPLKKQCSFIAYGTSLTCMPEYTGNIAMAKRYGNLEWIKAQAVFEGEEFLFEVDTETGRQKVVKHTRHIDTFGKNVIGAYAMFKVKDQPVDMEFMTIDQIRKSWDQGAAKGASKAHKNFTDEMAKKTVINRATKMIIRTSDDSALFDDDDEDSPSSAVKKGIEDTTATQEIEFVQHEEIESKVDGQKKETPEVDSPTKKVDEASVDSPKKTQPSKQSEAKAEKEVEYDEDPFDF